MNLAAVACALLSALLFAAAAPAAKLLVGVVDPWLLAGLFYAGSGVGLAAVRLVGRGRRVRAEAPIARGDIPWLAGAILFGGVVGPVLLMVGLARAPAATVSLLLTLEGAFSALIAWLAFRENYGRRIAAGMALILAGAAVLAWREEAASGDILGIAAVVGACLAWGLDNNLTRRVSLADPVQIAMLKGLVAGPVSLGLAFAGGAAWPAPGVALRRQPRSLRDGAARPRHRANVRLLRDGALHRRSRGDGVPGRAADAGTDRRRRPHGRRRDSASRRAPRARA
jgi:drug/metabolite transporter (DMT)-like permease